MTTEKRRPGPGRPPVYNGPRVVRRIRFPAPQAAMLDREAARLGLTFTDLMTKHIWDHVRPSGPDFDSAAISDEQQRERIALLSDAEITEKVEQLVRDYDRGTNQGAGKRIRYVEWVQLGDQLAEILDILRLDRPALLQELLRSLDQQSGHWEGTMLEAAADAYATRYDRAFVVVMWRRALVVDAAPLPFEEA